MARKKKASKNKFPVIHFDKENDYTSIRLADGLEKKSFEKDGFVFLEDARGKTIEIQILNRESKTLKKSAPKITKIKKGKTDNLSISLDYDMDESKKYPVLLYTPNLDKTEDHFHISLTKKEAKLLRDWLDSYLD